MTYSKGPWRYDAESGEVLTSDRTGFWGPGHEPVSVCTVTPLDGVNNGPLLAEAAEMYRALKDLCFAFEASIHDHQDSRANLSARAILARLEASE